MYSLKNNKLEITVKKRGAELCKITAVKNNLDFLWHADPNVWPSHAPNLFPIIGALKNNTYFFEDEAYQMPKHGFFRHHEGIELHEKTKNSLCFKLASDVDLIKIFPFKFEFFITYILTDNVLEVVHTVKNTDNKILYFSVGGHPAFKCPVYKDEAYDDYFLEFEHIEQAKKHTLNMDNGLITSKTEPVLNNTKTLPLTHDMFKEDALVFKDLKSRKVALKSDKKGEILSVDYNGFPFLGIWAKTNGNYICIEPWLGIADSENTTQNLVNKEGILSLNPEKSFKASYSIEIHNNHLT